MRLGDRFAAAVEARAPRPWERDAFELACRELIGLRANIPGLVERQRKHLANGKGDASALDHGISLLVGEMFALSLDEPQGRMTAVDRLFLTAILVLARGRVATTSEALNRETVALSALAQQIRKEQQRSRGRSRPKSPMPGKVQRRADLIPEIRRLIREIQGRKPSLNENGVIRLLYEGLGGKGEFRNAETLRAWLNRTGLTADFGARKQRKPVST